MKEKLLLVSLVLTSFICVDNIAQASYQPLPALRVFTHHSPFEINNEFNFIDKKNITGANVVVADVTGDAQPEIITATSLNVEPKITILSSEGEKVNEFLAYHPDFGRGVTIATGDVNGDGVNEIITGTEYLAAPHVRVFNYKGEEVLTKGGWFAYAKQSRHGVNVAAGDIYGDGIDVIVTAPGYGSDPIVKIFKGDGEFIDSFWGYDKDFKQGLSVAVGDVNADGYADIITANQGYGKSWVRVFHVYKHAVYLRSEWLAYADEFVGGVSLQSRDVDNDGKVEIITSINGLGGPHVKIFNSEGNLEDEFFAYTDGWQDYGLRVDAGDLDQDGKMEFVTMPHHALTSSDQRAGKAIEVDLAKQQLYAWNNGRLEHTFLISSGINRFPSPVGEFNVFRKLDTHDYVWSYGEGSPYNYSLYNVQYNLNFKPHYYIHYAYWHNNFGVQMSHGCINAPLAESEWIYNWADVDTPVSLHR